MSSTSGTSNTRLRRPSSLHAKHGIILWMTKTKNHHLLTLFARVHRKILQRKTKKSSNNGSCLTIKNTRLLPRSWPKLIIQLPMGGLLRWQIRPEVFESSGARSFPPLRAERTGDERPSAQRMLMGLYPTPANVITHPSSLQRKSLTMRVKPALINSL